MPTTIRRDHRDNFVIGINGCRWGWVVVQRGLDNKGANTGVEPAFRASLNGAVTQ